MGLLQSTAPPVAGIAGSLGVDDTKGVRMARATVLLVEDDADLRYLLGERLRGVFPEDRIIVAESAEAGLEHAQCASVDVIVLDLYLSGMDGFTFANAVRRDPRPPIIALTGDGRAQVRARAREAGFVDFLEKPADLDRLADAVRRVLPRT
jgi:CheY-like chemotaxis protein